MLEEVGQGGMAIVYRGLDTALDREVAVKVLHPHLADQPESRARLEREAHAVAKLRHDNILEIFDYSGPDSSESFIVTELIEGITLKRFLAEHVLPFVELAEMIASEVARALEHAHAHAVIHRDIKPENVMIRKDGLVKLTDFGIAQIVDKERMTMTGQLLGSPAYMAPEHVDGRPLDFRTDVFALGILIYQLATGKLPFSGKNPHEVLRRISECQYTRPSQVNPLIGARLERVITRALEREPAARFADVTLLRRELTADLSDAGVADPRETLRSYFAAPATFAAQFRAPLVAALCASGRAINARGRTAAALELWGRGLQLDPKNDELRALVDGLSRRRGRWRIAGGLVAALGVASAVTIGIRRESKLGNTTARQTQTRTPAQTQTSTRTQTQTPTSTRTQTPTSTSTRTPTPTSTRTRTQTPTSTSTGTPTQTRTQTRTPTAAHARTRTLELEHPRHQEAHANAHAAVELRTIELVPSPKAVRVVLDGKPLGDFGPALSHVKIGPGAHNVLFESPFCFPRTVPIPTDLPDGGKVAARLRWKPATLTVRANVKSADVLIDGNLTARSDQPIPITIPELAPDGRRSLEVQVSAAGRGAVVRRLTLRANEIHVESVTLPGAP